MASLTVDAPVGEITGLGSKTRMVNSTVGFADTNSYDKLAKVSKLTATTRLKTTNATGETRNRNNEVVKTEGAAEFTSELQQKFYVTVLGEMSQMADLANGNAQDQADLRALLREPLFAPFKAMYDRHVHEKAGTTLREVDEDSLKTYIATDRGYLDAMDIGSVKLKVMGLNAAAVFDETLQGPLPGPIDRHGDDATVTRAKGGAAREGLANFNHWLQTPLRSHGVDMPVLGMERRLEPVAAATLFTMALVGVGTAIAPGLGTAAGAAVGVGISLGIERLSHFFDRADRVTVEQAQEAYDLIRNFSAVNGPDADLYSKWGQVMYKISPQMWQLNGNQVGVRQDILDGTQLADPSYDPRMIRDSMHELFSMVTEAQKEKGIRKALTGGLDEINERSPQIGQRGELLEDAVRRRLKQEIGYMQGGIRVPHQVEWPLGSGTWVDNTGVQQARRHFWFNPGTNAYMLATAAGPPNPLSGFVDIPAYNHQLVDQNQVWYRTQQLTHEILAERIVRHHDQIIEGKRTRLADLRDVAKEKRESRKAGGSVALAEIKRREREQSRLAEDKAYLDVEIDPFAKLAEPLEARIDAIRLRDEAQRRVTVGGLVPSYPLTVTLGGGATRTINNVEEALGFVFADTTAPNAQPVFEIEIDGTVISGIAGQKREAIDNAATLKQNARGRANARGLTEEMADINQQLQLDLEEIDQGPVALLISVRQAIENANKAIVGTPKNPNDPNNPNGTSGAQTEIDKFINSAGDIQSTTRNMEQWRQTMIGPPGWRATIPVGQQNAGTIIEITDADLQNVAYGELLTRINQINAINHAMGWPAEGPGGNNRDNRMRLFYAIAEAQAASNSLLIDTPGPIFLSALNAGLQEQQLLFSSTARLSTELNNRNVQIIPQGGGQARNLTLQEVEALQAVAVERFNARKLALNGAQYTIDRFDAREKLNIKNIKENGLPQGEEAQVLLRLVDRFDDAGDELTRMTRAQFLEFLDTRAASVVSPTYFREAERIPVVGGVPGGIIPQGGTIAELSYAEARLFRAVFDNRTDDEGKPVSEADMDTAARRNFRWVNNELVRRLMIQHARFDFLRTAPVPATLNEAFDRIRLEVEADRLDVIEFAQFVHQALIMNYAFNRIQTL